MNANKAVATSSVIFSILLTGFGVAQAHTKNEGNASSAVSKLEYDAVKADLAGDAAFYQKRLADDWTRGDSDGTFFTKAQVVRLMADPNKFKTSTESLTDLKVRIYGDTAVATYKDTYDIQIMGQRRAHSIIATDTFVKMRGEWKQVASHGAETK